MSSLAAKVESFWYSGSPWRWLLYPLSLAFFGLTNCKRWLYKAGILASKSAGVPVTVVGNITVGGTGKTPFIAMLAARLTAAGVAVGIVSRGYQSNAPYYPYLVTVNDPVSRLGDEAFMQYSNLGLPMCIGPDRAAAAKHLAENFQLDLIISDDGLQHYAMARQFEILLVDGQRGFGNRLSLPFGPLRESARRIDSVDFVVQNGGAGLLADIEGTDKPTALTQMSAVSFVQLNSGESRGLDSFESMQVEAVCGIGNPQRFYNSLAPLCETMRCHRFNDHHAFSESDFKAIDVDNAVIVMTEKDAVKCRDFARDNWYFLKVAATMDAHQQSALEKRILTMISEENSRNG